jgi:hypothetical protein
VSLVQILLGTGRWQCEALTEGGLDVAQRLPTASSTGLRPVPLPVPGRI